MFTFDFMPGWSLLDLPGRQNDKSAYQSPDTVMIMFAIWDIGEHTEAASSALPQFPPARSRLPRYTHTRNGDVNNSSDGASNFQNEIEGPELSPAEAEARRVKNAKRAAARKRAKKAKKAAAETTATNEEAVSAPTDGF